MAIGDAPPRRALDVLATVGDRIDRGHRAGMMARFSVWLLEAFDFFLVTFWLIAITHNQFHGKWRLRPSALYRLYRSGYRYRFLHGQSCHSLYVPVHLCRCRIQRAVVDQRAQQQARCLGYL